ncbi:MAG: hypothetical protein FWC79_07235 [Oscillospiraceae bacterium]|nr:hypothetical protein [Oscillospiraceae bacterium]
MTSATNIITSQTFDYFFPLTTALILYFIMIGGFTLVLSIIEKLINPRKA